MAPRPMTWPISYCTPSARMSVSRMGSSGSCGSADFAAGVPQRRQKAASFGSAVEQLPHWANRPLGQEEGGMIGGSGARGKVSRR